MAGATIATTRGAAVGTAAGTAAEAAGSIPASAPSTSATTTIDDSEAGHRPGHSLSGGAEEPRARRVSSWRNELVGLDGDGGRAGSVRLIPEISDGARRLALMASAPDSRYSLPQHVPAARSCDRATEAPDRTVRPSRRDCGTNRSAAGRKHDAEVGPGLRRRPDAGAT